MLHYLLLKIIKKPKSDKEGFTLIELLVAIVILAILTAIALPSFLGLASKGNQAEGQQYTNDIATAEQRYYPANHGQFVTETKNLGALGVGLNLTKSNNWSTSNYSYQLQPISEGGDLSGVVVIATPVSNAPYKGYLEAVGLIYPEGASDPVLSTVRCQSKGVGVLASLSASDVSVVEGAPGSGGASMTCAGNAEPIQ